MKYKVIIGFIFITFFSCNYLDIVPDDIPTLEHAFHDRPRAQRYLHTCYSYLPAFGTAYDPGLVTDEIWSNPERSYNFPNMGCDILYYNGNNTTSPILDFWNGLNGGSPLWQGIRDCNTFLENFGQVIDLNEHEKARWVAEVKFLKAFYHFYLLQLYGPIPIVKENMPVSSSTKEVAVYREPVDEVFDYIIELLDEAIPDLPLEIYNKVSELGRITKPIALSVKAKILVTAASPLFNGNTDYATLIDKRGKQMFNQTYDPEKWKRAVDACKMAIDACHEAGHQLYKFSAPLLISDSTKYVLQVSQIITDKWNAEHIWGWTSNSRWYRSLENEQFTIPPLHPNHRVFTGGGTWAPTMKIVEMFYSENGVPIDEDLTYDYGDRYGLTTVPDQAFYFMQPQFITAKLHLNREPRFYGSIGVDGGWWFGLGRLDDKNQWPIRAKVGEISGKMGVARFSPTSFYIKKQHNFESAYNGTNYVDKKWNWPIFRLADLYLLYAEALNEANNSPPEEIYDYLDPIRKRAGLDGVRESWSNYSKLPDKFTTQSGMREIIHRERAIELAFEMHRFWDLRRWKKALESFGQPIQGWNVNKETSEEFYQVITIRNVDYHLKDVLWPIRQYDLSVNTNLFQNPGW
jgi:hypothetical protein